MAWIEGLAAVSGPRWSAGGTWGDSDWANGATWDAAHAYAADTDVSLGVYLHGRDVTEDVIGASWGLGATALIPTSLRPSSCSIELRSTAGGFALEGFDPTGFEPVAKDVGIGRRVVILTEWDVLWVGRVEASAVTYDAEQSARAGGPRYTLRLSAVDDLARAAQAPHDEDEPMSFDTVLAMRELLAEAGLPTVIVGTPAYEGDPDNGWGGTTHEGRALDLLAELTYQSVSIAAYTPSGYYVAPMALDWSTDLANPVESYDAFHARTITYNVSDVYTLAEVTYGASVALWDADDEIPLYGRRQLDIDTTDWVSYSQTQVDWGMIWTDLNAPVARLSASARINAQRHAVARLMPLSQLSDDDPDGADATEWWRVLQVQHRLTPDAWSVSIEAVAISGPT